MREDWEVRSFEKCVIKITPPKKVKSTEYHVNGLYPIISQDNNIISGYWDNINDIVNINKPVVIFGDHTRVVKYVDYNFVVGADGVIILQPIQEIISKYFYYYLKSSYIPNLGYSRHYKLLKNFEIPIPPLQTQQQIVEELDCLTSIIEKQKKQLEELDNLAQAIFYDMFGDPIENEKGWKIVKFKNIGNIQGGYAFKSALFVNNGIPILKIGNINSGFFKGDNISYYKYDPSLTKYEIYPNDLVISMTGTVGKDDYGNICIIPSDYELYYLNQRNAKLIVNDSYNSVFISYVLKDKKVKRELTKNSKGVRQANISNNDILNLNLISPPLPLQQQFASKIEAIEKQKELIKKSIKETEDLFNSRMDYYFN